MCSLESVRVYDHVFMLLGLYESKPIDDTYRISILLSDGINTSVKRCYSRDFDLVTR